MTREGGGGNSSDDGSDDSGKGDGDVVTGSG